MRVLSVYICRFLFPFCTACMSFVTVFSNTFEKGKKAGGRGEKGSEVGKRIGLKAQIIPRPAIEPLLHKTGNTWRGKVGVLFR